MTSPSTTGPNGTCVGVILNSCWALMTSLIGLIAMHSARTDILKHLRCSPIRLKERVIIKACRSCRVPE